ncbi:hypothetical protein FIV34_11965 [Luteibacter pinisoli]|uniref:KAP NTPase domain-containing protein n=1 Tax=Luteibacter pinisoli TaxID=2589080 RepID=A0A4Y5Z659_9GAMM|nr:P-loop NTPase fold protein [Luteibacter pinisoli]QDE39875.1 hypothetical protein FIV34_11965 [Luteibacter pinisoli]
MTTALARTALTCFVTAQRPSAIALTGPWGSGKTWLWNDVVAKAAVAEPPPFKRYSYVSLFGLNSMAELKAALFENAVAPAQASQGATPATLATEMREVFVEETAVGAAWTFGAKAFWRTRRNAQNLAQFLPAWGAAIRSATFLAVRDYLICIDDVERKGKDLPMTDVLGLVSYLREQRNCRVVLILNEEGLGSVGNGERDLFAGFREKVLDREVVFTPTVEECRELVFGGMTGMSAMAGDVASGLGITNLRILQRLSRAVDEFSPFVASALAAVQASLARTLALLVWCHYGQAAGAPGYLFAKEVLLSHFAGLMETDKLAEPEAGWVNTLWAMGGQLYHGLVQEVCNTLDRGYLDADAVNTAVADATAQAEREAASGSMADAWRLLHNTFADNRAVFVDTLATTATAHARWLGYGEVETVCVVLRKLNEAARADDLAREWVRINAAIDPARLVVPEEHFGPREEDPMFRSEALGHAQAPHRPTLAETIREQVDKSGWNPIDIEVLSTATVSEYVTFFMNAGPDEDLSRYVHACLRFARINSTDGRLLAIAQTASEALRIIAAMSPLNKLRVMKFPLVSAPTPPAPTPPPLNPFVQED